MDGCVLGGWRQCGVDGSQRGFGGIALGPGLRGGSFSPGILSPSLPFFLALSRCGFGLVKLVKVSWQLRGP